MNWEKAALAIMCMPCRRDGGHFVPTSELVLASLDAERRHPVFDLAARLREGWADALHGQGIVEVVVAVDDLAVERSWMLPHRTVRVQDLWPRVRRAMARVLAEARLPLSCHVLAWSQLVDPATHEKQVTRLAQVCLEGGPAEGHTALHRAMGGEIARRRRFHRATGHRQEEGTMRRRAADQVANYAAQGVLVHARGIRAYLPWTEQESALMSTYEPRFAKHLAGSCYGAPGPSAPSTRPWERLPARFTGLAQTLQLYTDDLSRTPGAVRPGLADAVADALADLLTPGTHERALRRIRALNEVMPGGTLNRERVRRLLERAQTAPVEPEWALEQTVKKLYCQLASRYSDQEEETGHARHQQVLTDLAAQLEQADGEHTVLALTGSLARVREEGIWHPYFSDIDVMPLFTTQPSEEQVERIRAAYARTEKPRWLLLNEGAREGVAGLTHDPVRGLFVADRMHTLTAAEFAKLSRLVGPMRRVAGSRRVFSVFADTHRNQRKVRAGQAARIEEADHAG